MNPNPDGSSFSGQAQQERLLTEAQSVGVYLLMSPSRITFFLFYRTIHVDHVECISIYIYIYIMFFTLLIFHTGLP